MEQFQNINVIGLIANMLPQKLKYSGLQEETVIDGN